MEHKNTFFSVLWMGRRVKIGELFLEINFHQKEVKLHEPNYVFLSHVVGILHGVDRWSPWKQVVSLGFSLSFIQG